MATLRYVAYLAEDPAKAWSISTIVFSAPKSSAAHRTAILPSPTVFII